jgi:hypothetical protein
MALALGLGAIFIWDVRVKVKVPTSGKTGQKWGTLQRARTVNKA